MSRRTASMIVGHGSGLYLWLVTMFVSDMRRVRPAGITGLTMPGRVRGQMRQRPRSTGPDAPAAPLPDGFPAVTFQRCATEPGSLALIHGPSVPRSWKAPVAAVTGQA